MDLVVCLKSTALVGNRESLIFSAVCAVALLYLRFGIRHRLTQRITLSVLIFFMLLLALGSMYVDCLRPYLL